MRIIRMGIVGRMAAIFLERKRVFASPEAFQASPPPPYPIDGAV
jgi:hypothetical protein